METLTYRHPRVSNRGGGRRVPHEEEFLSAARVNRLLPRTVVLLSFYNDG